MTALFCATVILSLTLSPVLSGCTTKRTDNFKSNDINSDTALSATEQLSRTNTSDKQKSELTEIYTQAIGDFIRLVNEEYKLTFDTLFFGKHTNGQPTDFPEIELPSVIENTSIKLITPEQGDKNQKEQNSRFYINLIGSVNANDADFIFVTFSNGFAHQFDCFITYLYDTHENAFVMDTTRFEHYLYKTK